MASSKVKRKSSYGDDLNHIHTIDSPLRKKPKITKVVAHTTPVEDVRPGRTSQTVRQPREKMPAMSDDMARQVAAYVAVHKSDTPEEARIRRAQARKQLGVTHVRSDAKLAELLARKKEDDELRMLKMYKIVPLKTSLKRKELRSTSPSQKENDKGPESTDTSDEEEGDDNSIFGDLEAGIRETVNKAHSSPLRISNDGHMVDLRMANVEAINAQDSSLSDATSASTKAPAPPVIFDPQPVTQVDSPKSRDHSTCHQCGLSPSTPVHSPALSSDTFHHPATNGTKGDTKSSLLKRTVDDTHVVQEENTVGTQYIYIESRYFTAIMGEGEMEARTMERDTNTKIIFSPWDELKLVRCDITGHPAATGEVKTRILCAVVELRHRHLVGSRPHPQSAVFSGIAANLRATQLSGHAQEESQATTQSSQQPSPASPTYDLSPHAPSELSPIRTVSCLPSSRESYTDTFGSSLPDPLATSGRQDSFSQTRSHDYTAPDMAQSIIAVRPPPSVQSAQVDMVHSDFPQGHSMEFYKCPANGSVLQNPVAADVDRPLVSDSQARRVTSVSPGKQENGIDSVTHSSLGDGSLFMIIDFNL